MTDSRSKMVEAILQALQTGNRLQDEVLSGYQPVPRPDLTGSETVLEQFLAMLSRVGGEGHILSGEAAVAAQLRQILAEVAGKSVLVPPDPELERLGVPEMVKAAGVEALIPGEVALEVAAGAAMGITTAQAGLAETGTVALWHTAERGRRAALLPPCHIVLLKKGCVYLDKITWLETMRRESLDLGATPMTWVTGPSLTADIEKVLVRGAHGPRRVVVLLY